MPNVSTLSLARMTAACYSGSQIGEMAMLLLPSRNYASLWAENARLVCDAVS